MPMYHNNHGRTTAMWTGTTIVTIGFLVGTIALTIAQPWLFWLGVALVPIGAVVGKAMAIAGMGQPQHGSETATTEDTATDSANA